MPLGAQQLTGFTGASTAAQRAAEQAAIARPDGAHAKEFSRALSDGPHVAGTPGQAKTRDYVIEQMKAMGLTTEVREYQIWMPHPTKIEVWANGKALDLREGPVKGDETSAKYPETLPINGYGGSGDAEGEVVFVNFGLVEDYATLDSLGVSVKGKVAVARYGRSFRGIKAREAEKHGAVALLIYTDPQDDGYVQGDVYPDGPWRPAQGIQRGSVMNGAGDPSTPGYGSTAGVPRIALDKMPVPHIPVVPIGYGNASEILSLVRGTAIPHGWQGGMAFRYHVGPGPSRARVKVSTDTATAPLKAIWNTFGVVKGTELPDEIVVIGGHRDAWGPGAGDNVSGVVAILEAARAVAEQMKAGWKPRRTMLFATWDAEEWGIIGSTEYAEDDSLRLMKGGVAYFNQDGAGGGPNFGGGGSPSLRGMLRDVTKTIMHPDAPTKSMYQMWREQSKVAAGQEPAMGDPGGGSDFAGFYNHLGIPHSDWGMGGTGGGTYHSLYDSFEWLVRFADPQFKYHAAQARVATAMMMRIANADVLPYDYAEFGRTMKQYVAPVDKAAAGKGWTLNTAPLSAAIAAMETSGVAFNATRDSVLSATPAKGATTRANAALLQVERALTRPEGLRTRPWYRNLIYVADENNGYSNMVFPSVNEAIRAGDQGLAQRELNDLVQRFGAATAAIDRARAALVSK
ncbi:MAG: M20/M25/M40 family metallo-hydrolase [Gemmatimonadetes bacterium]|nr:M20/M25/M40 family metallo-hydrolase [Gemmatimonadota bacterium]